MKNGKKVGIYDRWLFTLGGGEQVAFAYATALRDLGYRVDILTHKKVDLALIKQKMHLNLRSINIRYLPNLLDFQLSQYTEEYDIFICNSYLDYITNRSKFGILSIFFPSKVYLSLFEYFKRVLFIPSLRNFFIYPSRFEGFRYDVIVKGKIYKWLGQNSIITFNKNINRLKLELYFDSLAFSLLDRISFSLGKEKIYPRIRKVDTNKNFVSYYFIFSKATVGVGLEINLPKSEFSEDVALIQITIPKYRYFLYNIFKLLFPRLEMRLHGGPSVTRLSDIESYDKILAISEFSQKWIHSFWGLQSDVLYPPIFTNNFRPSEYKKNIIVNIGRFFVTGHCKKQLELARVFKKIVAKGVKDWELHFIGSIAEGEAHLRYFEAVKEESSGFPIFFHINAPFEKLRTILSQAKIYWHATGLDEDSKKAPIRMEHFGITTVEAMASGCVPVVINKGGQSEIVTEESGYLWNTREELFDFTKKLIKNPKLLRKKRQKAIERSKFFSKENFRRELQKHLPKS